VGQREIPAPVPSPETEAFWQAAADGKLLLRRCIGCGRVHWYPRAVCPFCFGDASEWVEASGRGLIYSYSIMRRTAERYAIAYVTLAEGPTMLTNLVACDFDRLRVGQAVKLAFTPTRDGPPVPTFTLA
jgi:uncharacterized OB-fold protein